MPLKICFWWTDRLDDLSFIKSSVSLRSTQLLFPFFAQFVPFTKTESKSVRVVWLFFILVAYIGSLEVAKIQSPQYFEFDNSKFSKSIGVQFNFFVDCNDDLNSLHTCNVRLNIVLFLHVRRCRWRFVSFGHTLSAMSTLRVICSFRPRLYQLLKVWLFSLTTQNIIWHS